MDILFKFGKCETHKIIPKHGYRRFDSKANFKSLHKEHDDFDDINFIFLEWIWR